MQPELLMTYFFIKLMFILEKLEDAYKLLCYTCTILLDPAVSRF